MKTSLKQTYKLYHEMYFLECTVNGTMTKRASWLRAALNRVGKLLDASGDSYKAVA